MELIKVDKTLILNTIQEHYRYKSDSDFAKFLEIKPQVLSNWKNRNTFDIEILYTKCLDISPDFMITGKEPFLKGNIENNDMIEEAKSIYVKEPMLIKYQNEIIEILKREVEDLRCDKDLLKKIIEVRL